MPTQAYIQLNTDGSGKKLDTVTTTSAAQHRQVFVVGDPATDAGVAPVDAVNGLSVNVTNASIAATVSGVATAANQSTGNTSLSNIDTNAGATTDAAATAGSTGTISAKLRRISADIDSVKTSVSSLDGKTTAVNTGSVTVGAALPAGTNAIGKLASNTGVTIGAVELAASQTLGSIGTSVTPGTSAAHLGKAEDAAHSSGDTGVMSLGVRNDAMATLSGTDGDYTPIAVTSSGRVQVSRTTHSNMVRGNATATTTSDTSLIAAAGVGVKNYITAIQVSNSSSTNCVITIKDGSGGSTLAYIPVPANGGALPYYDIPLVSSANTAIYFASNNAASTIYVSAQGYTSS